MRSTSSAGGQARLGFGLTPTQASYTGADQFSDLGVFWII